MSPWFFTLGKSICRLVQKKIRQEIVGMFGIVSVTVEIGMAALS